MISSWIVFTKRKATFFCLQRAKSACRKQ